MQLLVSVSSALDAAAALAGGADLIDAKDPAAGVLGAVSLDQFHRIVSAVAGARPVTAALGDAWDEAVIERSAGAFAAAGATFVKIGFAGIASADRVADLIAAAVRGVSGAPGARACVVPVAYADADGARAMSGDVLVGIAARVGVVGVLLDTFDKRRGTLRDLIPQRALGAWVATAHDAGLFVAL